MCFLEERVFGRGKGCEICVGGRFWDLAFDFVRGTYG